MGTSNEAWQKKGNQLFIGNYARYPVTMVKGEGCRLLDANGRRYLDFLAGIAVCSLGHCHPEVTAAICSQAGELVHVSNLYYTKPQTELAELLITNSFAEKVFMCNSGAEANEAAIKLARIHSGEGKYGVISLEGSFHGRTLAAVAATGQPKFHQGFEPMPEGFKHAPFGDIEALEKMIDHTTCAIMIEPIQGESGVRPLEQDYLRAIRELCDKHGLLLIFDEVQTGIGRTGSLFAYQQLDVVPDIMTSAKGLASGLPIGAMMTTESIASALVPGTHASTFGGNPVASAAAVATLKVMLEEDFFTSVLEKSSYFQDKLGELVNSFPALCSGVRGRGMMLGLVLTESGREHGVEIVNQLLERGCIINFAGGVALRFVPPLIVEKEEIDELVGALTTVLAGINP